MTNFYGNTGDQNTAGDVPAPPGAAPLGAGAMQGNPQASQFEPFGALQPQPQCGGVGQTINTPQLHAQIAQGNVPLNVQPTNVTQGAPAGSDSLLAMMSRGQVSLNQSNYGQPGSAPAGGNSPQLANVPTPVTTGAPSTVQVGAPANYTGN